MSVTGRLDTKADHERPDPEGGANTVLGYKWINVKTSSLSGELIGPSAEQMEFKFEKAEDIREGDFLYFDYPETGKTNVKHEVIGIHGKISGRQPWLRGTLQRKDTAFGS